VETASAAITISDLPTISDSLVTHNHFHESKLVTCIEQLKKNFELGGSHPCKHVGPKAKNHKQQSICRNLPGSNNILLLENDQTGREKPRRFARKSSLLNSQAVDYTSLRRILDCVSHGPVQIRQRGFPAAPESTDAHPESESANHNPDLKPKFRKKISWQPKILNSS
jgi:hypothetical protein